MTHRFPISEIAQQAGLGLATVDRVLNNRANVSQQTKLRVKAAIEELIAKEDQLVARARRLFFDFVVVGSDRYISALKEATNAVLPRIETAVCQFRFIQHDGLEDEEVVGTLMRILKRGSHGVCIDAPSSLRLKEAIEALTASRIPVVTHASDIPNSGRSCHVGLDFEGAGQTAAYLISKTVKNMTGTVLLPYSADQSLGDNKRTTAFLEALSEQCPKMRTVAVKTERDVMSNAHQLLQRISSRKTELSAVYSSSSDNRLIIKALRDYGFKPEVYVTHDVDLENSDLISDLTVDFILNHDLRSDIETVCNALLACHQLEISPNAVAPSTVQLLTPHNIHAYSELN